MDTVKQSTETLIACILLDDSDFKTPETGIAAGSVTISYTKEGDSSWSAKTATGNWDEIGKGVYDITWSTTDLNTLGTFKFVVESSGCLNYYGAVRVVAKLVDDLNDMDPDDVWDELKAGHTTADSFGDYLDDEITSRSSHAANDVRDAILSDSTPFDGADIDAAITTRSSHAAADVVALMNDPTVAAIADGVWDELYATHVTVGSFAELIKDYLDAAISSIASAADNADAVWDELKAAHTTPGSFGDYLDIEVSGRSSHSAADVVALMNDPTVAAIADGVWDELYAPHVTVGSFAELIKDNLDAAVSSRSSHAAADVVALMNDVTANEVRDAILSDSTPFDGADIAAIVSAIAGLNDISAADVDTELIIAHGAGSWEGGGAAPTVEDIADGVWNESRTGHIGAGTFGLYLDAQITTRSSHAAADVVALMNDLSAAEILAAITSDSTKFAGGDIDAAVSSRSSHSAADVQALLNDVTANEVRDAILSDSTPFDGADIPAIVSAIAGLNDLAVTDILSDSTAFAGADVALIKAAIAALNDISAADVDTELIIAHGAGSWEGGGAAPTVAEIWGEAQSGYTTPGTFGYYLDAAISSVGGGAAPSAAEIAEEVHNVKRYFDKTTGVEIIKLADDSTISTRTITDTETTVQKE